MKTIATIIMLTASTIILCGQNLNVDNYPLNYDINNAIISDNKVVFNGGLVVGTDSSLTISFTTPVMCKNVRIFGPFLSGGEYKHISVFNKIDYTSSQSMSGSISYYGIYGAGWDFDNMYNNEYNLKVFSFIALAGNARIDSIKFDIEGQAQSEYQKGYFDGYMYGYFVGYNSVDTLPIYNHGVTYGYANGVASVDTLASYNRGVTYGYANGVASVDTLASYNRGIADGIASINISAVYNEGYTNGIASVDTLPIYNHGVTYGYANGVASIDTLSIYNMGYDMGLASTDTTTIYNNGYIAGQNDCYTNAINEKYVEMSVNAFPNPTSGWVTIECNDFDHVDIYNATGILMGTSTDLTIMLADYGVGIYFLRVFNATNEIGMVKVLFN